MLDKITVDLWQRGGMVTQRIANPFTPVRFRALPPNKLLCYIKKKVSWPKLHSSVAQLVEQLTVNQLVAGSSPARGAKLYIALEIPVETVCILLFNFIFCSAVSSEYIFIKKLVALVTVFMLNSNIFYSIFKRGNYGE